MAADDPQARGDRRRQKIGYRYGAAIHGRVMRLEDRTSAATQGIGVLQEKGSLGSLDVGNQIEIGHPRSAPGSRAASALALLPPYRPDGRCPGNY